MSESERNYKDKAPNMVKEKERHTIDSNLYSFVVNERIDSF